jgi:hypothetical protein
MRRWFFDVNYHRHDKAKRRSRRLVAFFVTLTLLGGGAVAVYILFFENPNAGPSNPTQAVQSVHTVPSKVFRTKYFELETPETWEFEKKASGPNTFVYHNVRFKLVRGFITIYVNKDPMPHHKQATRLLPVEIGNDGLLKPDSNATEHCNKKAPHKDKVGEEIVKLKGITFMCDNDATWYSVVLALKGGTPQMSLKGMDGQLATYVIYYQDSSANPTDAALIEVIRNFKIL